MYLTPHSRAYAAKRVAHGSFRAKAGGLGKGHVKPRKNLKFNTGARSVQVTAGISARRVLFFRFVKGSWNAETAAHMYSKKLTPALAATRPQKRRHLILEDNDPSGYKSKRAIAAKAANKIDVLELPRRSPDLNPLDYGSWAELNKRLRRQEQHFPKNKVEGKEEHIQRLRRTAMIFSPGTLSKLVQSMQRRCRALPPARGRDFED